MTVDVVSFLAGAAVCLMCLVGGAGLLCAMVANVMRRALS